MLQLPPRSGQPAALCVRQGFNTRSSAFPPSACVAYAAASQLPHNCPRSCLAATSQLPSQLPCSIYLAAALTALHHRSQRAGIPCAVATNDYERFARSQLAALGAVQTNPAAAAAAAAALHDASLHSPPPPFALQDP